MATLLNSESKRSYSWWWDSHISPKNSKWLQENLEDIDAKVKAMIKLIDEEADSFARRAEMYYKKRPELIKLVEEFYRAYRALAERYDHAMVELRQAHKTIAKAFPNQELYVLINHSSSGSLASDAESRAPVEPDDSQKAPFGSSSISSVTRENERSSEECDSQKYDETEQSGEAESEIQTLRKALAKIQSDKDAIFLQYQKSLDKLSEMERDLNKALKDAGCLDERASRAEIEIKILKEALVELKAEKDAGQVQYNQCLESIARLENMLSLAQLDAKGLDERAVKAETEAKNLKQELTRLEAQKDAGLLQHKQCLEKIFVLEAKISLAEENCRMLNEQNERAEMEIKALRKNLAQLNEERESVAVHYQHCLEKISEMENEILGARENSEQLHREVEEGVQKLKSAEKLRETLEKSNQSLRLEAENLAQKIAMKDQALLEKHTEIERLQTLMHEDHSHFLEIESTLESLQTLYSKSQQEQRSLVSELKHGLQLLKDFELSKQGSKEEMQDIADENRFLHGLSFSSTMSLKKQQMEISKLKEINEKLEREFAVNNEESYALQQELHQIKDDIQYLNTRYQVMLEQVQCLGLNPKSFAASVKDLQNENSKLKEVCKMDRDEKEALHEKINDMDELLIENASMEFSLSRLNDELVGLRATVKKFQDSCQFLQEENSILTEEKSTLLSQLQIVTESMQKMVEKNTLLEKSLSDVKIELEGLKAKSDDLENLCKLLNDEKHNLLKERSFLVSQLESVEAKLCNLERRFTMLEEKYDDVEKDKARAENEVQELRASVLVQKQKRANHKHSSEARLANLESLVRVLQEERRLGKIEFEDELDRAVNAQLEMFIMQSCIEDLEQKNLALLDECERHVEASKLSNKFISELESENLMQLVEEEFLLHEIRKIKVAIHQLCAALHIDPDDGHYKGIKQEEMPTLRILENIEGLKSSLVKIQEEKQKLLEENSVLASSLQQHQSEREKLESEKKIMEEEFENMREQNAMLQKEKIELLEKNRQLRTEIANGEEKENTSKSELAALHMELKDSLRTNQVLQEENSKMLEEKISLSRSVSDLKDVISAAEVEKSVILDEVLALSNLRLVYESVLTEKIIEQKATSEHLSNLSHLNSDLTQEVGVLRKNLEEKEAENVCLKESTERMEKELQEVKNAKFRLSHQIENPENLLNKKEVELLEMEKRLKAAETLNAEFGRSIEELKMELEESRLIKENLDRQILELSENCMHNKTEIEHLDEANRTLLSEMRSLIHEVQQHRVREEALKSELHDKTQEFQILEAEAAAIYFDHHILSIREELLKSKVTELTGVCKRLDNESTAKSLVIDQMTERVGLLENENEGLKGKCSAYTPTITSLKEDFSSLENTFLLWTNKKSAADNTEQKDVMIKTCVQKSGNQSSRENKSTLTPDGVSDLLSMQRRIRAVEKILMEEIERHVKEETLPANVEAGAVTEMTEDSNLEATDNRKVVMEIKDDCRNEHSGWRTKPESRLLMKDIQLDHNSDDPESEYYRRDHSRTNDHMLEICETDQHEVSEVNKHGSDNSEKCQDYSSELEAEKELGVDKLELWKTIKDTSGDSKRKILQRLSSDAQKLAILKMTLQDLKKKPETKKKSKKGNDIEYETVKRHIEEVEEAVLQQAGINDKLAKDIEVSTQSSERESSVEMEKNGHIQTRRVTEEARRGSEQIGRLQFEVQNIQYILLKLADEKNNKGKNRSSKPTGVSLRNFIQIGRKNSKRRSKACGCAGCSRPSTSED